MTTVWSWKCVWCDAIQYRASSAMPDGCYHCLHALDAMLGPVCATAADAGQARGECAALWAAMEGRLVELANNDYPMNVDELVTPDGM